MVLFKQFDSNTGKISVVGYSLSEFEVDYDYHTWRKGYLHSATAAGYDNHMIWQSQLLFKCPIPPAFHEQVKSGDTVVNDYSTLFVDLIPIRTPPRYTPPKEFFPPRYNFKGDIDHLFVADYEFGKDHILPKIDESGRWENIVSVAGCSLHHNCVLQYVLTIQSLFFSARLYAQSNDSWSGTKGRRSECARYTSRTYY